MDTTQYNAPHHATSVAFRIKGSLFPVTFFQLHNHNADQFLTHLQRTVEHAPNLLKNALAIIDLALLAPAPSTVDLNAIKAHLTTHDIIPIGVTNINPSLYPCAHAAGLTILPAKSNARTTTQIAPPSTEAAAPSYERLTLLVDKPIRSGQQIYARDRDLIVLHSVSPGAELLADGHIHIYGTLRGRALAGVSGDQQARIFCTQLDAELVSIAGYYKLHEDLSPPEEHTPQQIFLRNGVLCMDGI